ncbi:hypothetical protein WICPIJ_001724 [Wickerhamomyces pijperi]|uniref:Uncharacterized protein n=1 Tax=Wickerhamomyces pijperi TaxID=599730 RepID=A0A9P8TQB7_WICPI|nr:hypothetical protein WICPIJ_001724 [Wickerhamomyces pijperi]
MDDLKTVVLELGPELGVGHLAEQKEDETDFAFEWNSVAFDSESVVVAAVAELAAAELEDIAETPGFESLVAGTESQLE